MSNRKRKIQRRPTSPVAPTLAPPIAMIHAAVAHHQAGRRAEAEQGYRQILALDPQHADSLHLLGLLTHEAGNSSLAIELMRRSIRANPNNPAVWNNLGNTLKDLARYDEAVSTYDQAIRLLPTYAEAYSNRGVAQHAQGDYPSALTSYDAAIHAKPDFAEAYSNRAATLQALRRYQSALDDANQAIYLSPSLEQAHANQGAALMLLNHPSLALLSLDTALRLDPRHAEAHCNRGSVLLRLGHCEQALASFDRALALNANLAAAHFGRGSALYQLKRLDESLTSLNQSLELDPLGESVAGFRLFVQRLLCDWHRADDELHRLEQAVALGRKATDPFSFVVLSGSPALQRKAAELYLEHLPSQQVSLSPFADQHLDKKIRIGYFSADFHNHATAYLIAELFERHDKARFEITGFSYGPDVHDAMRHRIIAAMDRLIDVSSLDDAEIAQLSRDLTIDIAVDLKGFTADNRRGIFRHRAAPVQISFLGFPGTSGAPWIDYLIADPILIPKSERPHYSESIVYMPDSYQPNDARRPVAPFSRTRAEEGLPETGFVYCCFNNNYKITPAIFAAWARILKRVEGSVLWLLEDNHWAAHNLRKEAVRHDLAPNRLIFAARRPLDQHLARHQLASLFLDTLPCNAHTTASDALWAGLPLLTCVGQTFASRVAASLLNAIDLPGLVTTSLPEYEEQAVAYGLNAGKLAAVTARLKHNRTTTPLFDCALYTRHLESAYTSIHLRSQAALAPRTFSVLNP